MLAIVALIVPWISDIQVPSTTATATSVERPPEVTPGATPGATAGEPDGQAAAHAWTDFDGDGRLDLLVLGQSGPRLYRNGGDGAFEDVSHAIRGAGPGGVRCVAWADFDGDGRPDLLLVGGAGSSRLMLNRGEWQFDDRSAELGLALDREVLSARVLDLDADGDPDVHLETDRGGALLHNRGAEGAAWRAFEWSDLPASPGEAASEAGPLLDEVSSPPSGLPQASPGSDPRPDPAPSAAPAGSTPHGSRPARASAGGDPGGGSGVTGASTTADAGGPALDRAPAGACASGVRDQSSGACLAASSVPSLGALYPLGPELFIDPSGQVGVGNLAPQARLDVVGIGSGVEALRVSQGDLRLRGTSRLVADDGSQQPREALASFGEDLLLGNDSWQAVHIGPAASLTVDASGRVGVNESQPTAALDVRGNGLDALRVEQGTLRVGSASSVALDDSSQTPLDALASFGGDELLVGNDSWSAIHVGPAASLTVSSTGRVGINEQQPQASLDVRGNGLDAVSVDQGRLRIGSASSVAVVDSSQTPLDALASFGGDELLVGNDSWSAIHVGPAASLTVSSTGRVGVNQQQPQASLDVRGNGLDALRVEQGRLTVASSSSVAIEVPGESTRDALASFGGNELLIGNDSWDAVQIGPASSLTVESTGRVGINQSAPQASLDVRGNGQDAIRVENGRLTVSSSSSVALESPSQGTRDALASSGGDELLVGNDSWSSVQVGPQGSLTVDSSGRVGVNESQPQAPLHLRGNGFEALRVEQGRLRLDSSSSVAFESFSFGTLDALTSFGGEELYVGNDSWNAIHLGQQGSLVVDSTGRVGINESSPQAALDVRGNGFDAIRIQQGSLSVGSASTVRLEDSTGSPLDALASFGGDDLLVGNDSWSAVHIGPFGSLTVTSTGNVGIGDASPGNVLTVPQNSATDPIADAWTTYSSRRWKEDVETFEGALETIGELRGVRYRWKESGRPDVGFIAEEVGAVLPELVRFEENGVDARSVDYARMTAVLVQAVKEQQALIEDLREDVERLKAGREPLARGR